MSTENTNTEKKTAVDVVGILKENEELKTENTELKADLEVAGNIIQDLKIELEAAQKKASERSATGLPQVKVGKTTYDIVIPKFRFGGETKTAEDVQKDNKLAAELVKAGSGVLQEHED